jgi:hypothetical protein
MARIAWYPFNEASSGTGPTTVADGDANPQNLTITYAGSAAWTSIAAGDGLNIANATGAFAKSGVLSGTKFDAWAGTQATLTVAMRFNKADNFAFGFERPGVADVFWIVHTPGAPQFVVHYSGAPSDQLGIINTGAIAAGDQIVVFSFVWDSPQVTQNNRMRGVASVSGSIGTALTSTSGVTQNYSPSFPTDTVLTLGNQADGNDPLNGVVFACLVHDHALSSTEITDIHTALLADNDADPEGGGGGGGAVTEPGPQVAPRSRSLLGVGARPVRHGSIWAAREPNAPLIQRAV